jgi:hypothetical protein
MEKYSTIVLPNRSQPDTLIAVFLLKKFGESYFPGIASAKMEFWQVLPEGETNQSLQSKGYFLIDIGSGPFDHHAAQFQTTATDLVATALEITDDPALSKLFEYARRDDFYGKGIISNDALDRAFGLSGLVVTLNRYFASDPARVVDLVLPFFEAHYAEEVRRTKELPEEFAEKLKSGEAEEFAVRQRDKNLKVVIVASDNSSLAGYLRSQQGGRFDVVVQRLTSGHVNILTRPTKRVDLRMLAAKIRTAEMHFQKKIFPLDLRQLTNRGRLKEIPDWYYDPATNSIQNGGLNPIGVKPTRIPREEFPKLIKEGLGEG